jgi:very-short-patch-repair endonuclease
MSYYCYECDEDITDKVYRYSKENFNKALCRDCQKSYRKKPERPKYIGLIKGKKNKKVPTPEAKKLFNALKAQGVPAVYEKWDGYKHIDIAVVEAKINIEVDGAHHNFKPKQALADLKRTFHSFKKGYITLRIPNALVKNHLKETTDYIVDLLNASNDQLDNADYY